ncbi:MAG: helix-turn-helix transcriptional regulator [Clostridia bacterium]|nr:helix-turn-helix transcriptional regulator [Clostridia bacterium]
MLHPVIRPLRISGFYGFFDYIYEKDYFFEGEHHHFWEVAYCLSGTAGISADEKIYRLHPGDLVIYRPYVHHKLWSDGNAACHVMDVSFDAEGTLLDTLGGAYSCNASLQHDWHILHEMLVQSNCPKKITGYLHYLEAVPAEFQQVTNLFENNLLSLEKNGLPLGFNQSKTALNYEQIIRTMRCHLAEYLSVDELARECGLSVSSMKKLFRHYNSMGVHEYYLHLKMQEAVRLMKEGRTVTETAALLGFSNQSYFSTVFKKKWGLCPTYFKQNG